MIISCYCSTVTLSSNSVIRYQIILIQCHIIRIQSLFSIILHRLGITIQSLFSIMYYLGDTLLGFSHYFVLNYLILLSFHWILSIIEFYIRWTFQSCIVIFKSSRIEETITNLLSSFNRLFNIRIQYRYPFI